MNKIIILLTFLIILLFFLSCTVNDYFGLIKVENHTETELRDVKVGDTLITSNVAPGNYVDYWFSYDIIGQVTLEGVDVNEYQDDITFKFKPGYWIYITAQTFRDDDQVEITVRKQGSEQDEEWIED